MLHLCSYKNAQLGIIDQKNAILNAPIFQSKRHHFIPFMPFSMQNQSKLLAQKTKNPIFFGGGVPFHGSVREINQPS